MSWEKIAFGELYKSPTKNGIYKEKNNHGSGVKIVNMGEIFAYDFIGSQDMKRIELTEIEVQNFGLEENDLLFARRSLVESGAGKASIVANLVEPATFESSIIRVRLNTEICSPLFYLYWFRSLAGRAAISAIVTGINVKGIRGSDLKEIKVDYPSIEQQRGIAKILKKYDDLIENNQKQIKLLEEAAQRFYKEWFVALRFPGHESTPIIDGVPQGWKVIEIGNAFKTLLGGTPSREKAEYWENGTIPWINSGKVNELRVVEPSEYITDIALNRSATKLLPNHTTLVAITGATLGQVSYTEIETCANQSVVGIVDESQQYSEYVYCYVLDNIKNIIGKATGGAQQHINKDIVNSYQIVLPSDEIANRFKSVAKPIFDKISKLLFENIKLTEARDRLLQKLMSGELEV